MSKISVITVLSLVSTVFSDTGSAWVFTDGRGAMPMATDLITMEAESVSIVPDVSVPPYYSADLNVTCVFYLRNLTDQPLDVPVFSPFESFYQGNFRWSSGDDRPYRRTERNYANTLENMNSEEGEHTSADSLVPEWLQFRAFTADEEYDITYRKGLVNEDMRLVFWPVMACWTMHFDPGERIRLVNTYNTGWDYDEYFAWVSSFTYITRSGATWAGRIGDAVISLTVPESYSVSSSDYRYWLWGGSPHIEGNTLTWHYTDWEPEEDISFTAFGTPAYIDVINFIVPGFYNTLTNSWKPEELYPEAIEMFNISRDVLSAETIAAYLERWAYIMFGMIEPDPGQYFDRFFVSDEPFFDQLKMDAVTELQQHLANCRNTMESAGLSFLLPMAVARRNWSDVNMEMYCDNPRQQIAYLILLENLQNAVYGEPVVDPAMESLFWLTGWFLPGEASPMQNRFTEGYDLEHNSLSIDIVSRAEVEDFWINGGGCEIPLVRSVRAGDMNPDLQALSIEVSSEYSGQDGGNYPGANLIDGSCETAWLEGSGGYGYGESITVSVIDEIEAEGFSLVNGCSESADAWNENSRVRKLLVCLNDRPFMVAQLLDVRDVQIVHFPCSLNLDSNDRLSLEIVEVYSGSTYRNTGLSELSLVL